jgi:phage terminase small subunit
MFGLEKATQQAAQLVEADAAAQPSAESLEALPGSDLTEAQRNFGLALLVSGNRSAAYRQAYPRCQSDNTAKTEGARLARDPRVQRFMAAVSAKVIDLAAVSVGQIKEQAARIAFADVAQAFREGSTDMLPPSEWPLNLRLAAQGVKIRDTEHGQDLQVKMPDKNQALRLLAELGGHLTKEKGDNGAVSFHFHVPGMGKGGKRPANARQMPDAEERLVGSGSAEPVA